MKNFISLFLLCFELLEVHGQVNLVPNPSFEERTGCPQGFPDLNGVCNDWMSFSGTPDYFHNCSLICGYDNGYGGQEPNSGEAYAGFITYGITIPNIREHLGVELNSQLEIGEKYFLSFYVSTAWNYTGINIATNNIGALFSTFPYSFANGNVDIQNLAHINSTIILADTINWIKVAGSFIADSSYSYLVFGNFFDDAHTDTLNLPYQQVLQRSYYYIDDICLSTDSLFTDSWTSLSTNELEYNPFSILPNPTADFVKVKAKNKLDEISLYDCLGQLVLSKSSIYENEIELDLTSFPKGSYIIKLRNDKSLHLKHLIIN